MERNLYICFPRFSVRDAAGLTGGFYTRTVLNKYRGR